MTKNHKKNIDNLLAGASYGFLFGLVGYIIVFIFRIIVAKNLGAEQFGQYTLIETILKLLFLVSMLGIHNGITRYVPTYSSKKDAKKLSGYLHFVYYVPLCASIIVSLLVVLFAKSILVFFSLDPSMKIGLMLVALMIPFKVTTSYYRKMFVAKNKIIFREISHHIFEKIVLLLGAIIVVVLNLSVNELVLALFVSVFFAFVATFYLYKKKIFLSRSKIKTFKIKSWLNFSFPLFFTAMFGYVIGWSDNLIMGRILTFEELGIYAVAFSLGSLVGFFQGIFAIIFIPLISKAKSRKENIVPLFRKASGWIFGLTSIVFFFIMFHARDLLHVFFGKNFISGWIVFIIISIGMVVNVTTGLTLQILILHKKTWFIFWVNAIFAIINIVLNLILIPLLNIEGAAIASAISIASINFAFLLYAYKFEKISFDLKYSAIFFVVSLVAGLVSKGVSVLLNSTGSIQLIIIGVTYALCVVLFLLLLKPFDEEDIGIVETMEQKVGINIGFIKKLMVR